jgi:hypothetical protein
MIEALFMLTLLINAADGNQYVYRLDGPMTLADCMSTIKSTAVPEYAELVCEETEDQA